MKYLEYFESRSHARLGTVSNRIEAEQEKVRLLADAIKKVYSVYEVEIKEVDIKSGLSRIGLRFEDGPNIVIRRRSGVLQIVLQPGDVVGNELVIFFNSLGYFKKIDTITADRWFVYYLSYGDVEKLINDLETKFDREKLMKIYHTKIHSRRFDL